MTRTVVLFATLALVVALVATPAAGAAVGGVGPAQLDPAGNETAERPSPGARLAGVVAVHAAEVESEVETRAFGLRFSAADSNQTRATVVVERVTALRERAASIRERRQALQDALEDGTISRARYDAEMAAVTARSRALGHQLNQTESASHGLDADLLEERGVDATAIQNLKTQARNLTGPEAAENARSIAGHDVGGGLDGREIPPIRRPNGDSNGEAGGGVNITLGTGTPEATVTPTDPPRPGNRNTTDAGPRTPGLTDRPKLPEPGDRGEGRNGTLPTPDGHPLG